MIKEKGQVFILALIVLALVLINVLVIIGNALTFHQSSEYVQASVQAHHLAEAGIDKAVAAFNTAGTYGGESETNLEIGSYSVEVTSIDAGNKLIESTGFVPSKANAKASKTISIQVSKGIGTSFIYGVQVGEGGLDMGNNSKVLGTVYSNGNVIMKNGTSITGDVWVAGGVQATADQQSDCTSPNCVDLTFGKVSGGALDIAQSFKSANSNVLRKVALKLKKTGTPPDLTVRILANQGSQPDKNSVLASGLLSASLVTSEYGFVEVAFGTPPTLTAGTTYWIMVDTQEDLSNFWYWQGDSLQSYTNGNPLWSPNWSTGNPTWNPVTSPAAMDLAFKTYMGGVATYVDGPPGQAPVVNILGEAHANTLRYLDITKDAYYSAEDSIKVNGASCAGNPKCHPNSSDPPPAIMPISDSNIAEWKSAAASFGIQTGDITGCPSSVGPIKVVGNMTLINQCTVTVKTPIWVTGEMTLDNGVLLKLDSSYTSSGVIVVDGKMNLANNGRLEGSGATNSFLMGLTTFDSRTNGIIAIDADNIGTSTILYAGSGIINLKNSAKLQEVTGWKIQLGNLAIIEYSSGLANQFFSSGPGGEFSVVKGTYQVK